MTQSDAETPERKLHRLGLDIYASTEYEFYFTLCARQQGEPFRNQILAAAVVDSLIWTKARYGWRLFCYCLMPDHLHFLCRLTERDIVTLDGGVRGPVTLGVLDHIGRFKSFTTQRSWKMGFVGPLWQRSSYDRVIDMERPFVDIAQYVLENPIRKGLVREWSDWPYAKVVDAWW